MNKQQAFDFMVIRLADWFINHNKLNNYNEFNDRNNLGENKLKLLPFIICTANGKREVLFSKFNEFIAAEEGNIERTLSYNTEFYDSQLFNLIIKTDIILFEPNSPDSVLIEHLKIEAVDNYLEVIEGINNSINHIKATDKLDFEELINFSFDELSLIHRRHLSWRTFSNAEDEIVRKYHGIIPSKLLITEKSVLAYSQEFRIFA